LKQRIFAVGFLALAAISVDAQSINGIVDFGATDSAMSDQKIAGPKVEAQHISTVRGAVVPVYNLPGANDGLNISGEVLADISLGKIAKWNDPRIASETQYSSGCVELNAGPWQE